MHAPNIVLLPQNIQERVSGLPRKIKLLYFKVNALCLNLAIEGDLIAINSGEEKLFLYAALECITNQVDREELKKEVIIVLLHAEDSNSRKTFEK